MVLTTQHEVSNMKYFIMIIVIVFFVYMVIWSLRLISHTNRKEKMNRIQELREKQNNKKEKNEKPSDKNTPEPETMMEDTRDYWVNVEELRQAVNERERSRCYHYFDRVEECVRGLLLEIYDCGLVRVDELEKIAYGEDHLKNVDLSFLNRLDEEEEQMVKAMQEQQVMDAAKSLSQTDLGITDIHGTLSEGVEKVLQAVEEEKKMEEKKSEPIVKKQETSVEKARMDRKRTSNQEIRNRIFMKWDGYVTDLYQRIEIKASEETKHKVKKALLEYGYNDVDVLLKSPD